MEHMMIPPIPVQCWAYDDGGHRCGRPFLHRDKHDTRWTSTATLGPRAGTQTRQRHTWPYGRVLSRLRGSELPA